LVIIPVIYDIVADIRLKVVNWFRKVVHKEDAVSEE
jgi:HAE1 family hydrophobic/amphiphilic exporter-1